MDYIDVSQFNIVSDWSRVGREVGSVIVRVGYRGYGGAGSLMLDPKFRSHMGGAISAGLPVGGYFLTQAKTPDEARQEADFVASVLKSCKVSLPVFCDSEWSNPRHNGRADKLSAKSRTDCVLAFCERIKSHGYAAGVYASESWFREKLEFTRLSDVCIWCAKYSSAAPSLRYDYWQYTDAGKVDGIIGGVDLSKGMTAQVSHLPIQHYGFNVSAIDHIGYVPMPGSIGETVESAAKQTKWRERNPDVLINAELFNMLRYKPTSGVVTGGKVQLLTDTYGVSFVDGKKPTLSYKNGVGTKDWLGAYPLLLKDGKVAITTVPAGLSGKRARTALCWSTERCGICCLRANEGAELIDFAEAIRNLGYINAINLDGGGSTSYATPLATYEQGRKVRGKIGVWLHGGEGNRYAQDAGIMQRDVSKAAGVMLTVKTPCAVLASAPYGKEVRKLSAGDAVMWYGYHCRKQNTKWLYVRAETVNGYMCAENLS